MSRRAFPDLVLVRQRDRAWIPWRDSKSGQTLDWPALEKLDASERLSFRIEDSWSTGRGRRMPSGPK